MMLVCPNGMVCAWQMAGKQPELFALFERYTIKAGKNQLYY